MLTPPAQASTVFYCPAGSLGATGDINPWQFRRAAAMIAVYATPVCSTLKSMENLMPLLFPLIIALIIGGIIYSFYAAAQRRKELAAWAQSKGLRFDQSKNHGFEARYPLFKCLHQGHRQYAFNITTGSLLDRNFIGFDYHYETYSRDKDGHRKTHHHYFSAAVLGTDIPLKPLFIRPEGFFDKVTEFFGFDDIDFESAEFSKRFYVKAEDKRWAYDVLHARAMQYLLDAPRFTLQFAPDCVIIYRNSTFKIEDFESAAEVVDGLLDQLPDYLIKQQQALTSSTAMG